MGRLKQEGERRMKRKIELIFEIVEEKDDQGKKTGKIKWTKEAVIRCGNCEWWRMDEGEAVRHCHNVLYPRITGPKDYCSRGEKKGKGKTENEKPEKNPDRYTN